MNEISRLLLSIFIYSGYLQGSGEESFAEAVRGSRSRSGHDQTILPRRR